MKKAKVHPRKKMEMLRIDIKECEKIIDEVLNLPEQPVQKYLRASRKKDRKKSKLRAMQLWHGPY